LKNDLFRKEALDHFGRTDDFKQLLQVTSPAGWLAFLSILIVISIIFSWSIFGTVSTTVSGRGMITFSEGIVEVVSTGGGQVKTILVQVGDIVEQGQTIAILDLPELHSQIEKKKLRIAQEESQFETRKKYESSNLDLRLKYLEQERQSTQNYLASSEMRKEWLREKIAGQQELLEKGLGVKQDVLDTEYDIQQVDAEIDSLKIKLQKHVMEAQQYEQETRKKIHARELELNQLRWDLELLLDKLKHQANVRSPFTGKVLEIRAREGGVVQAGLPIISLESGSLGGQDLSAIAYFSPSNGKKIQPGMKVRVIPDTVKREEFGYILAHVASVSEYPMTYEGVLRQVGNPSLAKQVMDQGAPIAGSLSLQPNPQSSSGFQWSSGEGPPNKIRSGTTCVVEVEVRRQKPITLFQPYLRKVFGM